MTFISTMFHQGGRPMLWLLMLFGPALIIAIVHAAMARTGTLLGALAGLVLLVGVGLYGRHESRAMFDSYAGPDDAMMRDAVYAESNVPLKFALVLAAIVAVPVVIGEIRRRGKRRRLATDRSAHPG